ncbi:flavin reductase family protein [Brevundimonas sp. SORGH_AS_0993]|uniref:flavin reductase family protein n=1 Tax=Brevundimonas sp. SORGH_AS_0993 TaxID=3041794 RepID=UPI00277E682E|nr:flavin reductase family protein [Brevundimonas sp. SORGH_AS_0993]MDQ1155322.1 flavin reductase (DIM6/NTAB) family NADH-FMN oxidoreductase RutF [Brevundimonas sp. SORGH_AS_0993]
MTVSPPRIGGLDIQNRGSPDDPVVLMIGQAAPLSPDGRDIARALAEAGRHVLQVDLPQEDGAAALRRLLTDLSSRPAVLCAPAALNRVIPALAVTGPALASCLIVVGEGPMAAEATAALDDLPMLAVEPGQGAEALDRLNAAVLGFLEREAPREAVVYQAGSDARTLRDALGCFATGVTVVTTLDADGRPIGLTANSFSSVSLDPPLILFCLSRGSTNLERFQAARHFAINVLHIGQQPMSGVFARAGDRFQDVAWEAWDTGAPILSGSLASFECATDRVIEAGDHLIFIGRVLRARFEPRRDPLLYFRGKYRRLHFA